MPTTDDAWYAALPAAARKALKEGLESGSGPKIAKALAAVDFPLGATFPTADELTESQRALASILAQHETPDLKKGFAMPKSAAGRRRWLGIDPPGPLDARIDGKPLWQVLQQRRAAAADLYWGDPVFIAVPGPIGSLAANDRFAATVDLFASPYALDDLIDRARELCLASNDLDARAAAWAPALADSVLALNQKNLQAKSASATQLSPLERWQRLRSIAFFALVRARVSIEPRWDRLLPVGQLSGELLRECLDAIPNERRVPALVDALRDDSTTFNTVLELCCEVLPSPVLAQALLDRALPAAQSWVDATVASLGKRDAFRPLIEAFIERRRADQEFDPGKLAAGTRTAPTDLKKLGPVQREQVRRAMALYDVEDLEDSPLDHLTLIAIHGPDATTAYDAVMIVDGGTVFDAGTTNVVATIGQGHVESSKPKLAKALQRLVFARAK